MKEDLDKLIDNHWDYIQSVLDMHEETTRVIELCAFHYKTAFKHGYKHAMEDNTKLEEFVPYTITKT